MNLWFAKLPSNFDLQNDFESQEYVKYIKKSIFPTRTNDSYSHFRTFSSDGNAKSYR